MRVGRPRRFPRPQDARSTEALDRAAASELRPTVVVDGSDSTTAGGQRRRDRAARRARRARGPIEALLTVTDAAAVGACVRAGIGPTVEIGRRRRDHARVSAGPLSVARWSSLALGSDAARPALVADDLGRMAVLASVRWTWCSASARRGPRHGRLSPRRASSWHRYQVVQVKSAGGFRARYEPIAAAILEIETTGPCDSDLTRLPFRRIPRPMWPFDPDLEEPWADGEPAVTSAGSGRSDAPRPRPVDRRISRLAMPGESAARLGSGRCPRMAGASPIPDPAELIAPGARARPRCCASTATGSTQAFSTPVRSCAWWRWRAPATTRSTSPPPTGAASPSRTRAGPCSRRPPT